MRMKYLALAAAACLPALGAAPVHAQDGDAIVVTGAPESPEAVSNFVDAVSRRTVDGKVARWNGAICPQVTGLRDELNSYVAQSVNAIAQAVGVNAQGEGCDTNIVIVFMNEPSEFVETIRRERPAHLGSLSLQERSALASSTAAARSWSVNELRTRDGRLVRQLGSQQLDTDFELGGSQSVASRISNVLRADFSTVYLVVDLDQMSGVTMQQLSAFVAMQALTAADTARPIAPARTILNLFGNPEGAPADITDWDIAYLHALYRTDPAQEAPSQRSAIAQQMERILSGG